MKNQCYAGIHKLQLFTSVFIILLLFGQQIFAQTSLTVSTTVPTGLSQALNVGVGTASFSVDITNLTSTTTHISSLNINQPSGVTMVSAVSNIGTAVVNNNNIVLNIDLPANQKLTVQYNSKAGCEAVPDATTDFSVSVNNLITVFSSIGTKTVSTTSYPIVFPGLKIQTPASPLNNKAVQWRLPFTDIILC